MKIRSLLEYEREYIKDYIEQDSITEVFGWGDESRKMDRAIDDAVAFLESRSITDSERVKRVLLLTGKKMGISNVKKLFDRFHNRMRRGTVPSEYSFYSSVSLGGNDPRWVTELD